MCCCAQFSIAIFECDLCGVRTLIAVFAQSCNICGTRSLIVIFAARDLWLRSLWRVIFHCDLWLQYFLQTRIVQTLSLSDFLSRSDAVFSGLSFGRCGVLNWLLTLRRGSFGRRLFRTMFLSLDTACSNAGSFRLSFAFGRCLFRTFFWTMRGSDAVAYLWTWHFWTPSLSEAVFSENAALLRMLLLFIGRGCFCLYERGCSSSDADDFLGRSCFLRRGF